MHYIGSPAASSGPEFKTIARKEPVTSDEKVQTGKRYNQDSAVKSFYENSSRQHRDSEIVLLHLHPNFAIEKKPKKPKSPVKYSQNFIFYSYILTNYVVTI
jgi:hypothetical protein